MNLPLLQPDQIESQKRINQEEIQRRVWGLADEESRLVRSVNSLRLAHQKEEKRLEEMAATSEAVYLTRKGILIGEVEELESRRAKALEPVNKVLAEAEQYLEQNKKSADEIKAQKSDLTVRLRDLADDKNHFEVLKMEFDRKSFEKENEFSRRETFIVASENEIKQQTKKLSDDWVEFHTVSAAKDQSLVSRESDLRLSQRANIVIREELEGRKKALDERERGINDKYANLIAAEKEFNEKHGSGKKRQ